MDSGHQKDFSSLCVELMLEITSYLAPSDVLNLSLSCRSLHHHTEPVRRLHATAHETYNVTSDLLPTTMLELLMSIARGGLGVWHVRELEFWGSRLGWDDWRPWAIQDFETIHAVDSKASGSNLSREDMKYLFEIANRWWTIPEYDLDAARNELEFGGDGFLKMLLIASCPRLHSLKFVEKGLDLHTSLQWLTRAIGWSKVGGNWPPGFQSLRDMAVGVSLRARTESDSQAAERRPVDFAGILNLPEINRIYIRDLFEGDEEEEEEDVDDFQDEYQDSLFKYDSAQQGPSVQHIYLDSALSGDINNILVPEPKSLVSMTLRGGENHGYREGPNHVDSFVAGLGNDHEFNLESLMLYNPLSLGGYRCGTYRPEELRNYDGLKQFSIGVSDVELDAYYDTNAYPLGLAEFVQWLEDCEPFPRTMEALVLWEHPGGDCHWVESKTGLDSLDILDEFLVALINQKSDRYGDLKTIQAEIVEKAVIATQRQTPCFQKAIAAGRAAGVHVHTLTNRSDDGFWRKCLVAPDKFDLKTGPFGKRPDTWKINLATGNWEDPGCEGCGKCEECLRMYPEHVWKSVSSS